DRLAVADEREGADPDLVAGLFRLGLGQADAGDLRAAVSAAGYRVAIERVRVDVLVAEFLRDRLGRGDAFVTGLVREPWSRHAVADRPQALGLGAAVGVDLDKSAVHVDQLLEADVLGGRNDADGDDDMAVLAALDLAVLALGLRGDALVGVLELLDRGTGPDRHALPGEGLLEERGDVGVLDRNDPVEHLDHGHFGAHVVIEAGEFDADRARADDQQLCRHLGWSHRVAIVPHPFAVGRGERQVARPRTGSDDDVLGGQRLGTLLALHLERVGALEGAGAEVDRDLVLLHQVRDALVELLGHAAAALHHRLEIGLDPLRNEAVVLRVLHLVIDLGRAQQRLRRDAAPVEADTAEQLALDDRRLQPELRRADRRDIAAGA